MLFILAMSLADNKILTLIFRNIIISCSILLFTHNSFGQKRYTDFLSEEDIHKKTEIAIYLRNEYLRSDLDSLKILSVQLLLDAAENKNKFARAVGYFSLGSYLIRVENIEVGIHHLKQAQKYYELIGDLALLSEAYNEVGNGYHLLGENNKAIDAYLNSLTSGRNSPDQTAAFNAKIGLGKAYYVLGDTALGVITISQYKNQAIKFDKFEAAADAYAFLGQIEMDRRNNGLAREHYQKSIFYSGKSVSDIHLSHALNNKAILHFNLNEFDSCLFFFNKSLKIRQELNNLKGVAESYFNIGSYYKEKGELKAAESYFILSAELAHKNKFRVDEYDALTEMSAIYAQMNDVIKVDSTEEKISILSQYISGKKKMDEEIVEYTESIIGKTEMEGEISMKTEKSYAFISILVITVIILIALTYLIQKKREN